MYSKPKFLLFTADVVVLSSWSQLLASHLLLYALATLDTFFCLCKPSFWFISLPWGLHLLFLLPGNLSPAFTPLHSVPAWLSCSEGIFPAQSVLIAPQGHTLFCFMARIYPWNYLIYFFVCLLIFWISVSSHWEIGSVIVPIVCSLLGAEVHDSTFYKELTGSLDTPHLFWTVFP